MTIQKAIRLLTLEGLVYSRRGSGMYVMKNGLAKNYYDIKADEYYGLTQQMKGKQIESKILYFAFDSPSTEIADKLMIDTHQPIYKIHRLRLVDNEPHSLEYTQMPVSIIPNVTKDILKKSLYLYIQETLGLQLGGAARSIRADKPTLDDQTHLNCDQDDPVLEVEQVIHLADGLPFEYSRTRHRYDKGDVTYINFR